MNQQLSIAQQEQAIKSFLPRVYLWMTLGLLVTAAVAWTTASTESIRELVQGNPIVFFGLFIAQIVLVVVLSAAISRLSPPIAMLIFFAYSALTGLVFSILFIAYTLPSLAATFVATAGMFGVMSIIGLTTGMDLTKLGNIAFMALIGIIIASVINIFLASSALATIISIIGVLVFIVLIARDSQRLKVMASQVDVNSDQGQKASIMGALVLYLDFINLFLFLLRLTGNRR